MSPLARQAASPAQRSESPVGGPDLAGASVPAGRDEFERERQVLTSEIESLRTLVNQAALESEKTLSVRPGVQVLLAAKERLIRDEFERKYQELAIEVRRQRKQHTEQVDKLKQQLSDCICNTLHEPNKDRV